MELFAALLSHLITSHSPASALWRTNGRMKNPFLNDFSLAFLQRRILLHISRHGLLLHIMNYMKMETYTKYKVPSHAHVPYVTLFRRTSFSLSVRQRWSVSLADVEAWGSRRRINCVPAAAPSLGDDTAGAGAGCESGRVAGRPGWTEPATEPSQPTEPPGGPRPVLH